MKRILILDAYTPAGREGLTRAGARHAGGLYVRLFEQTQALSGVATQTVVSAYDEGFAFDEELSSFDAVVWTGSNLTVHRDTPAVRDQLALARRCFELGIPAFGSCWALQLAVVADGGECAANPLGREFGVSRKIRLTPEGQAHGMFARRDSGFDAFSSHEDHVVRVGQGTRVLAGNGFSPVQAVEVVRSGTPFWAVQYHPEYELDDVAALARARGAQLIEQGYFADDAAVRTYVEDFEALHTDPSRRDLAFARGVDAELSDVGTRACEFVNWVRSLAG